MADECVMWVPVFSNLYRLKTTDFISWKRDTKERYEVWVVAMWIRVKPVTRTLKEHTWCTWSSRVSTNDTAGSTSRSCSRSNATTTLREIQVLPWGHNTMMMMMMWSVPETCQSFIHLLQPMQTQTQANFSCTGSRTCCLLALNSKRNVVYRTDPSGRTI